MGRLIVFGSRGMLGQQVTSVSLESGTETITVGRGGDFSFKYRGGSLDQLNELLNLDENDTLVNCIGWIPQKSAGNLKLDAEVAHLLNTELIQGINILQKKTAMAWIQIQTDCVYSGQDGNYAEDSAKDATDLYGVSKIAGEMHMSGAIGIRSSIVGPDSESAAGLYAWFKNQVLNGTPVDGYLNATWNGVSTYAFAKLAVGIHNQRSLEPGNFHWLPDDSITKFQLLVEFAKHMGKSASLVRPIELQRPVNRTLSTLYPSRNIELWKLAGYDFPPTIEQLCDEFITRDFRQGRI